MAITVRDRDAIEKALEKIRSNAQAIYHGGIDKHKWTLNASAQDACDQISDLADSAATGFVNIVTCLTAKTTDPSIDCRYHREPGDGMPAPPGGKAKYF